MVKLDRNQIIGAAALGGLALAWVWAKGVKGAAQSAAEGATSAVLGMAEGTATGVVVGIGKAVGVPETSQTQCQKDIAAGRTWDASFSCPAGTWLKSLF